MRDNPFDNVLFLKAMLIGLRFDVSVSIYAILPLFILAWIPRYNFLNNTVLRILTNTLHLLLVLFIIFLTFADVGYYRHAGSRIDTNFITGISAPGDTIPMLIGIKHFIPFFIFFALFSTLF